MTGQKRLVIHYWVHVKVFVRLFRENLTFCTIFLDFVHCGGGVKKAKAHIDLGMSEKPV